MRTMRTRMLALLGSAALLAATGTALAVTTDGPEDLEVLTGTGAVETDEVVQPVRDRDRARVDRGVDDDGRPGRDRDRDGSCDPCEEVRARTHEHARLRQPAVRTYEHAGARQHAVRTHEHARPRERAGL
jgi:hypothetical protein